MKKKETAKKKETWRRKKLQWRKKAHFSGCETRNTMREIKHFLFTKIKLEVVPGSLFDGPVTHKQWREFWTNFMASVKFPCMIAPNKEVNESSNFPEPSEESLGQTPIVPEVLLSQ